MVEFVQPSLDEQQAAEARARGRLAEDAPEGLEPAIGFDKVVQSRVEKEMKHEVAADIYMRVPQLELPQLRSVLKLIKGFTGEAN